MFLFCLVQASTVRYNWVTTVVLGAVLPLEPVHTTPLSKIWQQTILPYFDSSVKGKKLNKE